MSRHTNIEAIYDSCRDSHPYLLDGKKVIDKLEKIIKRVKKSLLAGNIVCIKGEGGYQLLCDATNGKAVDKIRRIKRQPAKPLTVMFPEDKSLNILHNHLYLGGQEELLLRSPARPIVILEKRSLSKLSKLISLHLRQVAAILPSTPFHQLITQHFKHPLICTSASRQDTPPHTELAELPRELGMEIDLFLEYQQVITSAKKSAIYQFQHGEPLPLRLSSGEIPTEIQLPFSMAEPLLALGGENHNYLALAWEKRVVFTASAHPLNTPSALEPAITALEHNYEIEPQRLLCDSNPDLFNHQWAKQQSLPHQAIFHHHARASALAGEHPEVEQWITFVWDDAAYGEDGRLWGGETLSGRPGQWQRVGTLHPFRLPGIDVIDRQPWIAAAALCWEISCAWESCPRESAQLKHDWSRHHNTRDSSSVAQLFDAVASLLEITHQSSYRGETMLSLENLSLEQGKAIPIGIRQNPEGLYILDWRPLVPAMLDREIPMAQRAANFHATLAKGLLTQAERIRNETGCQHVGLSGSVFNNRLLDQMVTSELQQAGFQVYQQRQLACDDGALAFGQIIETAYRDRPENR